MSFPIKKSNENSTKTNSYPKHDKWKHRKPRFCVFNKVLKGIHVDHTAMESPNQRIKDSGIVSNQFLEVPPKGFSQKRRVRGVGG